MSVIVKGKNLNKPYTVRYWVDGKQRERSFKTAKEARDFQVKTDHDVRAQIFIDPKLGSESFATFADTWLDNYKCGERTKAAYADVLKVWVKPAFENYSIKQVAEARDTVQRLVNVDMTRNGKLLCTGRRGTARYLITTIISEAVRAGKITQHRLDGIEIIDNDDDDETPGDRSDFVFPTAKQHAAIVESAGIVADLMKGCGLRIEEAIAVERQDFVAPDTLRLCGQATRDGLRKVALKRRKKGEWEDVPVPAWLWVKVRDLPDGPLVPGNGRRFANCNTVRGRIMTAAKLAGVPEGFRCHSYRHQFASELLGLGVAITEVAKFMRHRNINVTFNTYGHLVPSAWGRAISMLDKAYTDWQGEAA